MHWGFNLPLRTRMGLVIRSNRFAKQERVGRFKYVSVTQVHRNVLKHIKAEFVVELLGLLKDIHVDTVAPNATRFQSVPSSTAKHLLPLSPSVQNTMRPAVPAEGNALTA